MRRVTPLIREKPPHASRNLRREGAFPSGDMFENLNHGPAGEQAFDDLAGGLKRTVVAVEHSRSEKTTGEKDVDPAISDEVKRASGIKRPLEIKTFRGARDADSGERFLIGGVGDTQMIT